MNPFVSFLYKNKVTVAFVIIFVFFAIFIPNFLSLNNLMSVGKQVAVNGIIATGMTFVIITGGIDLSVGSLLAVAGVFCAMLVKSGVNSMVVILLTIGLGILIGLTNGLVITKLKIAPFITTLAMLSILRAFALGMSGGRSVSGLGDTFRFIGRGEVFSIPFPLFIMIVVFIIFGFILAQTKFGTHVYAIGENEDTSNILGLKVDKNKIIVYCISGGLAALAAIIQTARLNSGQPLTGEGAELDAIAAVVIGGTDLNGGYGRIIGTVFGVAIMGMLTNGLILLNISFYYQLAVKGLVILFAVGVSRKK